MQKWKKMTLLSVACFSLMALVCGLTAEAAPSTSTVQNDAVTQRIQEVTGIADVFGDGEKVAAAVLRYPKPIAVDSVSVEDFSAERKTIEAVCVNDKPEFTDRSREGRYVVLKFSCQNTVYDGDLAQKPGKKETEKNNQGTDAPSRSDRQPPDLTLAVSQTGIVRAADGTVYPPDRQTIAAAAIREPVIDSFRQFKYTDPVTGISMPYNLYLPENYDAGRKYPLLFFVADASANINAVKAPLFQGNGATVWATPEEQKKHECIVLAPQYTADLVESIGMMTTDANRWTPGLTLITNLLFDVIGRYSVDEDRIYGTGQSQGGMTNIAISDKYPDLFAAQLLVACQWDVDEMEALKDKHLWIVVCEGDTKAFPGMNAATARWESLGARVARNKDFWDSKASSRVIEKDIRALEKQGANINYSVFQGGNHMYTWSFAYDLERVRNWLFRQKKSQNG